MNSKKLSLILVLLLFSSISYSAKAQTDSIASTLSVSGSGESKAKPDTAFLSIGVTTRGKTASEAVNANAASAQKLIDALIRAGIIEKDIQTNNVSVNPIFKRTPQIDNLENTIVGYEASNYLSATIHKVSDVGHIIDIVASTGNYTINGLNFSLEKQETFQEEALKKAVADAHRKADVVANAANTSITGIKKIIVDNSSGGFFESAKASADFATPVLPGDVTVSASVSIEYFIDK